MSKTIKNSRFDSDEDYQKRRSHLDRGKAKQELRMFISTIDDDEPVPYLYCR